LNVFGSRKITALAEGGRGAAEDFSSLESRRSPGELKAEEKIASRLEMATKRGQNRPIFHGGLHFLICRRAPGLRSEGFSIETMKAERAVRSYYVLPCCLLLLNICVELVSYKAREFGDPLLRTGAIMCMVLFGGGFVAFLATPAIEFLVGWMHQGSRRSGGMLGEVLFLTFLGLGIFWLYYQVYIVGPGSILPRDWRNGH
jgi:hypothetical protein